MCTAFPQDPSSPRSVQSYSSRENGLDKLPPSRKEPLPQASPTSLASSSSAASPSRSKEPPPVHILLENAHKHVYLMLNKCIAHLANKFFSLPQTKVSQYCFSHLHTPSAAKHISFLAFAVSLLKMQKRTVPAWVRLPLHLFFIDYIPFLNN